MAKEGRIYDTITTTVAISTTKHVVSKLTGWLETECCKLSSLRDGIAYMRDELNSMHAFLEKLGAADDDDGRHLDAQVREWRDEVRRLSADIEVCIADFRSRIGKEEDNDDGIGEEEDNDDGGAAARRGGRRRGKAVAAFFRGNAQKVATVGARHSIGSRIKKLKARINEINERRIRYNLDQL